MLRERGRPRKETSKRAYIKFRAGSEDTYKLYILSEKLGVSKSEIMRKALNTMFQVYKNRD